MMGLLLITILAAPGDARYAKYGSEVGPLTSNQRGKLGTAVSAIFPDLSTADLDEIFCIRKFRGARANKWDCLATDITDYTAAELLDLILSLASANNLSDQGGGVWEARKHYTARNTQAIVQMHNITNDACSTHIDNVYSWSARRDGANIYMTCNPIVVNTPTNWVADYTADPPVVIDTIGKE